MKPAKLLFEDHPQPPAAVRTTSSLARGLLLVLLIFAGTRLVTWVGTYHGAWMLFRIENRIDPPLEKHQRDLQEQFTTGQGPQVDAARDLLLDFAPLCRFDGVHYQSIIEGGYQYEKPDPNTVDRNQLEQNIAFFPLFPLIVRPITAVLSPHAAMILVTHLCSLAAGLLIYLWIRRRIDHPAALMSVAILFCWPPSVYFSYGYAEAVTLVLFVIALWLIDAHRWWPAAIVCALATATRPTALAIVAVLLLAYWLHSNTPIRQRLTRLALLGLVGAGGIIGYAAFLTFRFGSPLVYIANFKAGWVPDKNRADWLGYITFTPVFEQFKYFRDLVAFAPPVGLINTPNTLMWNMPLNLFIIFLCIAGLRRVPRSFRPLLWLGPLIFLHSYLASGGAKFGLEPIARYMAVTVPAFVVLAAWCTREWRPPARTVFMVFLILIQSAWAFRFGLQEWTG